MSNMLVVRQQQVIIHFRSQRLKTQFSQPPVVGNEKSQCLSSRGLPEESETHPDVNPSACIEGDMAV